jgi:hypothetical protein
MAFIEQEVILKSLFFFVSLWGLATAFLIFRPRVSFLWKIAAIMLFLFYIWVFREEILNGYNALVNDWYGSIVIFAKEMLALVFYLMFIFWPLSLIIIFYKADDIGAENLLKFMVVFTLMLWIVIGVYSFQKQGLDTFLDKTVKDILPFIK